MYDVAIIGAGVIGASIARELSKYNLKIIVIEKDSDVGNGITKANTAIIHSGYNAKDGTLKAKLNVESNSMIEKLCLELDVPFRRIGSLLIAFDDDGMKKVYDRYKRGINNGVNNIKILNKKELLKKEPALSEKVIGGLYAPSTGIISPCNFTIGLLENAVENGVILKLNSEVKDINKINNVYEIFLKKEKVISKNIINCGGLFADEIHNMVCIPKFKINPKRGQFIILDKSEEKIFKHAIFQAQKKPKKGITITKTVHGNLLIGPSSDKIEDKNDLGTTIDELELMIETAKGTSNNINFNKKIKEFAGIRPKIELLEKDNITGEVTVDDSFGDFIIEESNEVKGFIDVAGIKSPGLSASPAIAKYVVAILKKSIGKLEKKDNFNSTRKKVIRFNNLTKDEKNEIIKKDKRYGNIVCRCSCITEGEIVDCINRKVGARNVDGVKRRVSTGMGRCQGGFCENKIIKILGRELKKELSEIKRGNKGSYILMEK